MLFLLEIIQLLIETLIHLIKLCFICQRESYYIISIYLGILPCHSHIVHILPQLLSLLSKLDVVGNLICLANSILQSLLQLSQPLIDGIKNPLCE